VTHGNPQSSIVNRQSAIPNPQSAIPNDPPPRGLTAPSLPPIFEWSPLLAAHCGPLFTAAEPLPDGSLALAPGLADALRAVDALRREGLLAPSFGVSDQAAAQADFLAGRVAFLVSTLGFIRKLEAQRTPYRILPPPSGALGRPITTGALGVIAVVDSGDEIRIRAAHALARYLTSAEVADDVAGWYLAPPARASVTRFYDDPAYAPLRTILPTAVYVIPPVSAGFMERTLIPRLQAAVLGEQTPEEAVAEIQAAARRQSLGR
jgi:multiple sugar transport system substrate-binding protein